VLIDIEGNSDTIQNPSLLDARDFSLVIVAQEVSVNYNHKQSFANYHTMPGAHTTPAKSKIPFWRK
jgi:hypothetical protein